MALETIEVHPGSSGADAELSRRGYMFDPEFGKYGIVSNVVSQPFVTEADLVAHLAELLQLAGAIEGSSLTAFP